MIDAAFILACFAVVLLDIVMGVDNAIAIGALAAKFPSASRRKAILLGTAGAIVVRVAATLGIASLLGNPYILVVGGVWLVYIAWGMTQQHDSLAAEGALAPSQLWRMALSILVVDIVMGVDNIIAVAGAGHGEYGVIVFGLLLSIPIMVGGATLVAGAIQRHPWIVWVGAIVLYHAAFGMMVAGAHKIAPEWVGEYAGAAYQATLWMVAAVVTGLSLMYAHSLTLTLSASISKDGGLKKMTEEGFHDAHG